MGKNIKSYATTQVHFPEKGREALRQKVQNFWLKYGLVNHTHPFLNLQAKFFNYILWQNFQRIKQNSLNSPQSPRITRNSHHSFTHYTLRFRSMP